MLEQKLDKISQENQNQVVNIKISDVYPNGDQPRIYFDEDKIIALCESIKKHGVLQPIVVRPDDEGRYMIIAGERRYRASIKVRMQTAVKCATCLQSRLFLIQALQEFF